MKSGNVLIFQCLSTVSWCNGVGNEALVVVESNDQCKTKGQSDEHKVVDFFLPLLL